MLDAEFQFHKGTIRTEQSSIKDVGGFVFQFHKGTIRTESKAKLYDEDGISIP